MRILLIALMVIIPMFMGCAAVSKAQNTLDKPEVKAILDEIRKHVDEDAAMDKIEAKLNALMKDAEDKVREDIVKQIRLVKELDDTTFQKAVKRLEPIVKKASDKVEAAVNEAGSDIKANVKEEVMEEVTGKEINKVAGNGGKVGPAKTDTVKESVKVEPAKTDTIKESVKVEPAKIDTVKESVKVEPAKTDTVKESVKVEPAKTDTVKESVKVEPAKADTTKEPVKVPSVKEEMAPKPKPAPVKANE